MKRKTDGAIHQGSGILTGYEDRPYVGADLDIVIQMWKVSVAELASILGGLNPVHISNWRKEATVPLRPRVQVALRLFLRHPEVLPRRPKVDVNEFYQDVLGGPEALHVRHLAPLFGVDRNSGYSWLQKGAGARPVALILAMMLAVGRLKEMKGLSPEETLQIMIDIQNDVMRTLDVNPIANTNGRWTNPAHGVVPVVTLDSVKRVQEPRGGVRRIRRDATTDSAKKKKKK